MKRRTLLTLQLAPAQLRQRALPGLAPDLAGQREIEGLRRELAPFPAGLEIPRGGLGAQVALALRLIGSGSCPPVLQLAQAGYDTHAQ